MKLIVDWELHPGFVNCTYVDILMQALVMLGVKKDKFSTMPEPSSLTLEGTQIGEIHCRDYSYNEEDWSYEVEYRLYLEENFLKLHAEKLLEKATPLLTKSNLSVQVVIFSINT